MSNPRPNPLEERILLLAPTARDAATSRDLLTVEGLHCFICSNIAEVCEEIPRGAGAALLTAEAILADHEGRLTRLLQSQPAWSDLPLVVLTAPGTESPKALRALEAVGGVTLMKRPIQAPALVTTLRSALRDRRRQYRVKGLLAQHFQQAEALAEAEERLRSMIESVHDYAIFSMDDQGQVTTWNSGAVRVYGWSEDEIIGQSAAVLFTPEDRAAGALKQALETARDAGRNEDERWRVRKDGSRFFSSGVMTPIRGPCGALRGFTKVCRDITERKRAEESLREASRHKDEFLAMLAHELRNPLAPIRNTLQVMRLARFDQAAVDQSRAVMERQVAHMVRLIDDLLDVSRVSRGKVELRKERVELKAALNTALEISRPVLEAPGHHLIVSLPQHRTFVDADPTRLAQIVGNLLNNAARYTEAGGRIWLLAERDGKEVVIQVRDTGIGIPAEMLPKVFDLFTQEAPTLARSRGGLGIGLTLVKKLVEMHGGTVQASSEGRGRGSEFTVRLPFLPDSDPAADCAKERTPSVGGSRTKARRILVVDDNEDAATSFALLLELLGYEVQTVFDGAAALQAVDSNRPDIVFLDLGMPGMSGFEVARRLRERRDRAALRLVALTGWGADEDHRRSREAGFDHHFVKPVAPTDLQTYLNRIDTGSVVG